MADKANEMQKPIPLYPSYKALLTLNLNDYPELKQALLTENSSDWFQHHWQWALSFLKYIGHHKSEHTYLRFRNEVERFLLWSVFIKQGPISKFKKTDILEYADFCWHPPVHWIATANADRFIYRNGIYINNKKWRPFRLSLPKNQLVNIDKKKYKPSQQTLTSMFTAIIAFYHYLEDEALCYGNPAQLAKKDCRYFIADVQVKEVRRLTDAQWSYVLDVATALAEQNSRYERNLFIIATLKTLFLRISELSERRDWSPVMSHFWEDTDKNWWLKVYGKGKKLRDITVPTDFLDYLSRYRKYRGLPPLPYPGDNACLVEKIRGTGGMTARHLSRQVQYIFDQAYNRMEKEEGENAARQLRSASTHWLRHTGASIEIQRGRALKDLSEDLGHASMATTDTIYVQVENKKRAKSGKVRTVT